ncbi:MAG: hypothetical protein COV26_00180 [Candidatus Nealsonbacteria bacterium CG10_big_fil_rev_8_21_14_0_10_36_23]|uniref:Deoxynucleoside kinase domain-containing protein n=1 Tax=Candidatus Nealsonbacteria bacterium CG10_big_fil_rev_8_21_14_0_10_36_23 TaxID=1974709 RepID=A0A2H0TLV1_9BACT|nr:MAG: hypothetical protein COV26_00180 [Candidatus Nealsonbacteria bacterium CG10_big_fil_rev_8_21_14_0_10_36_23]
MTAELVKDQEKEAKNRHLRIGLMGIPASGKTTLAEKLQERWGDISVINERPEANPYLRDFYLADPKKWAFHSQFWFAEDKILMIPRQNSDFVSLVVPSLEMDKVYELTNYQMGRINEDEHELYLGMCEALCEEKGYQPPDLFILTKAPVDIIVDRIIKIRGRDYEKNIDREYLKLLSRTLELWIEENANKADILEVDSSAWNFRDLGIEQAVTVRQIEKAAKDTWYGKYQKQGTEDMDKLPYFLKWPNQANFADRPAGANHFY